MEGGGNVASGLPTFPGAEPDRIVCVIQGGEVGHSLVKGEKPCAAGGEASLRRHVAAGRYVLEKLMITNLFKNVEDAEAFAAGTTIFAEGDAPCGVMYVVQEGEVDILLHGECIDTVGAGAFLGEIGLVDQKPRSATAMAKTDCKVVPINQKRFNYLVQQTPYFALEVMQTIAERLRAYRG
jgi:CRP/FNR family transcriptional regulator, cyclic AMP receptor protein